MGFAGQADQHSNRTVDIVIFFIYICKGEKKILHKQLNPIRRELYHQPHGQRTNDERGGG